MHIHIVAPSGETLHPSYLISRLSEIWSKEYGHRITSGPVRTLDADIGILHVDRTHVPLEILPDNPEGRPLLNGSVLDISKRRFSRTVLNPGAEYEGPVLVKTNDNCYGEKENLELSVIRNCRRALSRHLPWQLVRELPKKTYPLFDSLTKVPSWVWRRKDLVVERFCPEREGEEYVLRIWAFLGDQDYCIKVFSREPVVKMKNKTRFEYDTGAVPEGLHALRKELKFDFGKFDYTMVDGQPVIFDVNKTPTVSPTSKPTQNLLRLAGGLTSFLEV